MPSTVTMVRSLSIFFSFILHHVRVDSSREMPSLMQCGGVALVLLSVALVAFDKEFNEKMARIKCCLFFGKGGGESNREEVSEGGSRNAKANEKDRVGDASKA